MLLAPCPSTASTSTAKVSRVKPSPTQAGAVQSGLGAAQTQVRGIIKRGRGLVGMGLTYLQVSSGPLQDGSRAVQVSSWSLGDRSRVSPGQGRDYSG